MIELASLHPLKAKGVPAQRRVRHELRLELAHGDRHLPTVGYCCQLLLSVRMLITTFIMSACARGTHLTTVPVDDARDERRLAHA